MTRPEVTLSTYLARVAIACSIVGTDEFITWAGRPERVRLTITISHDRAQAHIALRRTGASLEDAGFGVVTATCESRSTATGVEWVATFGVDVLTR